MTKRPKRVARKQQITELTVRKAKPQARAYLIWDSKQRGLALRVQPTGNRSWVFVFNRSGRTRWLTIMTLGADPGAEAYLSDARGLAAKHMLAVAEGKDPAAEKRAERVGGTFADLHARYLEHAMKHNKSWRQADALVKRFAIPKWGKLQASNVARSDVKALMAKIEAPIVANQVLAAISAIYTWATKEEIVAANPCKLVERNETRARERILADSEIQTFWNALDDLDPVVAAMLKTILLTGQRPGEVCNMRHEHVGDGWWTQPGEPVPGLWPGTKNARSHRVWLPQPALDALPKGSKVGFVFAGPRGRPTARLDDAMRDICKRLGIARTTPHDLRRTHGTTTARLFDRTVMNRLQNHKEGGIGDVYDVHDYADENKHAWETVAARLMALAEGREPEGNVVRGEFGKAADRAR